MGSSRKRCAPSSYRVIQPRRIWRTIPPKLYQDEALEAGGDATTGNVPSQGAAPRHPAYRMLSNRSLRSLLRNTCASASAHAAG